MGITIGVGHKTLRHTNSTYITFLHLGWLVDIVDSRQQTGGQDELREGLNRYYAKDGSQKVNYSTNLLAVEIHVMEMK